MAEKSILAYFFSPEEAESVKNKLQALRAADIQIDRIGRFPGEGNTETFSPLTGNIEGLAWLSGGADIDNRDAGILAAADPSLSGMSDGGQGGPTGRDILLTVVIDEASYDKALRLVSEAGGLV